jgi:hypothetical protein
VVEASEDEGESGRLKDCRVFFCTDNLTVEFAIYKGSSGSEKLHDLLVRYHYLESKYGITVTGCPLGLIKRSCFSHPLDGLSEAMIKLGVSCGLMVFGVPNSNTVAISGLPHRQLQMSRWKS